MTRFLRSRAIALWRRLRTGSVAGPAALIALGVVVFSVLALTAGTARANQAPVSTSKADIAAGRQLFNTHCSSCHGVNGVGGSNGAPPLVNAGAAAADFYLTTGRMPLNSVQDQPVRHHPFFDSKQIRQLVAYVNALPAINHVKATGPTIPTVTPVCKGGQAPARNSCVTLSEGQQLFSVNCAACHQIVGAGDIISHGLLVPSLRNASVLQAAEAPRVGPRPMPKFATSQLSNSQISAIAHYVYYLRHPSNRGGLDLGHLGPVAEGFVGVLVGFGLLLFVSRVIGTRG